MDRSYLKKKHKNIFTDFIIVLVINLVIGCLLFRSPYRWLAYYAMGDNTLYLPVAESILNGNGMAVDDYRESYPNGPFIEYQGRYYNRYPLGNSLVALPFVWGVNRLLGWSMHDRNSNVQLQFLLAFLTVGFFASFGYWVFRDVLGRMWSALHALGFTLGTSVISTMGVGFWSHSVGVCLAFVGMVMVVKLSRHEVKEVSRLFYGFLLGILFFAAYLCRPTFAVFTGIMVCGLAIHDWKNAAFSAVVFAFCLLLVSFFYYGQMGDYRAPAEVVQINAHYIHISLIGRLVDAGQAFYGHLLAPSRGLIVYSPFLLFAFWAVYRVEATFKFWVVLCAFWVVLHFFLISFFPGWRTGWHYGPRLWVDSMPAFFVLSAVAFHFMKSERNRVLVGLFFVLMAWSIFVHSRQGLFNLNTAKWNKVPNVDRYPEMLFSWRYPQFLASQEMIDERLVWMAGRHPELVGMREGDF